FALAVAFCAVLGCGGANGPARDAVPRESEGALAPDFQLDDVQGGIFLLSSHRGRSVVLLDFWATWCDPCKVEIPHLARLYDKYKEHGLVIVAISIDGPESIAQVRGDARNMGIPFPVLLDQETRVVAMYNPRRTAPYSVLIGRTGRVARRHEGYTPGDEE